MRSYKILIFSWNTQSVSLCETLNSTLAATNRESYSNYIPKLTTWQYDAEIPDFYPQFKNLILINKPDLIVIGFQEDRHPGSYFHSHLLPTEMEKIDFGLVKRTKMLGFGVTSVKGLKNKDPFRRGLRISVYAKNELIPSILLEELEMRSAIGNDGQDEYVCSNITRGKGAVASYVILPGFKRLVFICCHLPFNAQSLIDERKFRNPILRQNELNYSNECFNNIIQELVLFKNPVPTHVVYFGDFNYRLADYRSAKVVADELISNQFDLRYLYDLYQSHDELLDQMRKHNIYQFFEGTNNLGPNFLPTCKLKHDRTDNPGQGTDWWRVGKDDQRVPSWCDRILYSKVGICNEDLRCLYYDRFDHGQVMGKSDHAAVTALFELI